MRLRKMSAVAEAEIRWIIKSVMSGHSNADCNNLFQCMFSDSDVARRYQLGPDKLRYSVNFGLGYIS